MKSYKDFIYKVNDILLALAILVIACGLIFWRMSVIMDYPNTLGDQTAVEQTQGEDETQGSGEEQQDPAPDDEEETDEPEETDSVWNGDTLAKDVTVNVQSGSATAAVQSLIDAGLFADYDEFDQVCKSAKTNAENIKAGSFTFNAGSSKKDIAKTVTR